MKFLLLCLLVLLLPFFFMVGVNEWTKSRIQETGWRRKGVTAINPVRYTPEKCTWACHNDTGYCKSNHTGLPAAAVALIDPLYFGIIKSLHATGNYALANIIFLVVLFPALLYFLLMHCIKMEMQLSKLKKS